MRTAVVLFTRDLRARDQPALAAAAREAERIVPLFVLDPAIPAPPNRLAFLVESLADLRESLGGLVVREGDPVAETVRVVREVDASAVFASADVSGYAQRRERRLAREVDLRTYPGVTVVPPGDLAPASGDHYRVFTPYWRAWRELPPRDLESPVRHVEIPPIAPGSLPKAPKSPLPGGETAGRRRLAGWVRSGLDRYADLHDDLAADATSRLGAYLHLGCLSPLEVARRASASEAFVRQLCWRDFFHQIHGRPGRWPEPDRHDDPDVLDAWKAGRTGYPLVDAGMRQLATEGWMHNRARLVVGSFLTRRLGIDWREGARHFLELLVDGDVASNAGNWQWVAGTGANPRPNTVLNPVRQARRFDPSGDYVRRHVPELADVEGGAVHEPWRLDERPRGYPPPIVPPA